MTCQAIVCLIWKPHNDTMLTCTQTNVKEVEKNNIILL